MNPLAVLLKLFNAKICLEMVKYRYNPSLLDISLKYIFSLSYYYTGRPSYRFHYFKADKQNTVMSLFSEGVFLSH